MSTLESLLEAPFSQPRAQEKLARVRVSLALVVLLLLLLGPYGSFNAELSALLNMPSSAAHGLRRLTWLRWVSAALAATLTAGFRPRLTAALLCASFGFLNYSVAALNELWNYNAHLNFFLFSLCFEGGSGKEREQRASFILTAMQAYVATLYLQAGLSKLLFGGVEWALSGRTPWVYTMTIGSAFGKRLAAFPEVFQALAIGTMILELTFPVLCLSRRWRPRAAGLAIAYHLGVWALMRISFWHLWALFPALFWGDWRRRAE